MEWGRTIVKSFACLVIVGICAAMLVTPIWYMGIALPTEDNIGKFYWEGMAAAAGAIGVILNFILLGSIWLGIVTIREGQKSRSVELFQWAAEQMDRAKPSEQKLRLLAKIPYKDWSSADPDAKLHVQTALNAFSRLAYMVNKKMIPEKHFRELWGTNIFILWLILRDHVLKTRSDLGDKLALEDEAIIRRDFEIFARRAIDHYDRRRPGMVDAHIASFGRSRDPRNKYALSPIAEPSHEPGAATSPVEGVT